jgi:predicted nucleotide-binding protein
MSEGSAVCQRGSMKTRRPCIFVGSSAEAREIAEAVGENLADDGDIVLWTEAFRPGENFLGALERHAAHSDFAVLVWTPDDVTESRGQESVSPRDNVVLRSASG